MQVLLGFAGYSSKAPFDPSMMVHLRKRFSQEELHRIHELMAEKGKAMVKEVGASVPDDDDNSNDSGDPDVDASCTPADITDPTDLKLVNEARPSSEQIIDHLCDQRSDLPKHRPRYDRGRARANILSVALAGRLLRSSSRKSRAAAE